MLSLALASLMVMLSLLLTSLVMMLLSLLLAISVVLMPFRVLTFVIMAVLSVFLSIVLMVVWPIWLRTILWLTASTDASSLGGEAIGRRGSARLTWCSCSGWWFIGSIWGRSE
jgi:hypothetical protein